MMRFAALLLAGTTMCAAAAQARLRSRLRASRFSAPESTSPQSTPPSSIATAIQSPTSTPQEIAVTVDGRPRKIVSAQFISTAAAIEAKAAADANRRPDFSSNEQPTPGRLIALVVDQGNIRQGGERSVLKAAEGYLDRLTAADRVALFTIPAPGPFVPFTSDPDRVKDALRRIVGRYRMPTVRHNIAATEALGIEDGDGEVLTKVIARECARNDNACAQEVELEARAIAPQVTVRTNDTLTALTDVFTFLRSIDGPKTMALISEGLILGSGRFPDGIPREIEHLAAQARASVYVLRLDQVFFDASEARPMSAIDQTAQTVGLETIAGATGGELMTVVGTGAKIFDRLARETAGYYLIGIETAEPDRDGKPHRIKVSVKRGHATVRARREFAVTPAAGDSGGGDSSASAAILAALRAPLPARGLKMRAASYVLSDADQSKVRIVVSAELGEGFAGPSRVGLGYDLVDMQGKIVSGHAGPTTLQPGADGRLRYRQEFSVAPGDYTFKLAATDAAGHLGSLDRPIRAKLTRVGPLSVADLVLNDERDARRGTELDVEPVVSSGRLTCVVDMKTAPGALPRDVGVRFQLVGPDGRVEQSIASNLISSEDGARHIARATMDASALPAGEYVAQALITAEGTATGEVKRAFRIGR